MWEGTITGSFTFPGPHPYFFPLALRKLSLRGKDLDSPSLSVCLHLPIPVDLDASLPPHPHSIPHHISPITVLTTPQAAHQQTLRCPSFPAPMISSPSQPWGLTKY